MAERFRIRWEPHESTAIARVEQVRRLLPARLETNWPEFSSGNKLREMIGAHDPETGESIAKWATDRSAIIVSNKWIASLDEAAAAEYDLPPATKAGIEFYSTGIPSSSEFRTHIRFRTSGGLDLPRKVKGAFLLNDNSLERLPSPLFDVYNTALPLTQPIDDYAARIKALEHFTNNLASAGINVAADSFLDRLRIFYASGLSLALRIDGDDFDFDPILFGRGSDDFENSAIDESADSLLSDAHHREFLQAFLRRSGDMQASALGAGAFVYLDPFVTKAIKVVAQAKRKSPEERKLFALNPRHAFKESFADSPKDEAAIERLFIETDQYSSRVRAVEVWRPPVLPWIKRLPNSWLPESYGLRIDDEFVPIELVEATELELLIEEAIGKGEQEVEFKGRMIPATSKSLEAVSEIRLAAQTVDAARASSEEASQRDATEKFGKKFLVVDENFETVTYEPRLGRSEYEGLQQTLPSSLKTQLKKHQAAGFDWLTYAALLGNNGAVLADDMGLGKTLQALTFLIWWKERAHRRVGATKKPALIVAPTALQENWVNEVVAHFNAPTLSRRQIVSGTFLRSVKSGGRDIDTGIGSLDSARLREYDLLITTYETMRDYHLSFARIGFDIIVFDEAQKIKNPVSQTTRAAKSLNAEFILSMTGTPVENTLQDIWSIMDVTWPGFLGSSKEFSSRFDDASEVDLKCLNDILFSASPGCSPVMLRRLKSKEIEGLPPKTIERRSSPMPPGQAGAYLDVIRRVRGERGRGVVLNALHDWRSISVHPNSAPPFREGDVDAVINASARFKTTFEVLEEIHRKREKVLIFLEDLDWQIWLTNAIRFRFRLLDNPAIINGAVPGARRQSIVDRFQGESPGFGVMILSPKAAGVGLTITAANHVVHLSRWWNPAVEDQATDRTYRIGQTKPVSVYIPQATHPSLPIGASFDEKLDQLIERKRLMSGAFLAPYEARDEELAEFFNEIVAVDFASAGSVRETEVELNATALSSATEKIQSNSEGDNRTAKLERAIVLDPLPVGFTKVIPSVAAGVARPIDAATEILHLGLLEELWIEDPYFACSNVLIPSASFVRDVIFEGFGNPKVVWVRAFDPDHPKIRNQIRGAGKRAIEEEIRRKVGIGVRFKFEGPMARHFHDRSIIFVLMTPYGRKTIRWLLPGGLEHWLDKSRAQQATPQIVETLPRWTN